MNTELNTEQNVQPQTPETVIEIIDDIKPVSKKKFPKILLLPIVLIVGMGAYYLYGSNEKVILNNSVKLLQNFTDYIDSPFTLEESDNYTVSGTLTGAIVNAGDSAEIKQFNNIFKNSSLNFLIAQTKTEALINLDFNKNNKLLAGINVYSGQEKGYLFLEQIFSKYIEVAELKSALSSTNYNDTEDYKYLYTFISDSFVANMNDKNITKSSSKITINEKEKSVNTLTLNYNDKELLDLFEKIIADIKKDEKANKIVTNVFEEFSTFNIREVSEIDEEHMGTYAYIVYTDKLTNAVVGIDFKTKSFGVDYNYDECDYSEEFYDDCMKTIYTEENDAIEYRKNNSDRFSILEENALVGYVEIEKNKDVVTAKFYDKTSKEVGSAIITSNSNVFKIDLNVKTDDQTLKITFNNDIKEVAKGKEYNVNSTFTFIISDAEKEIFNVVLNSKNNIKNSPSPDSIVAFGKHKTLSSMNAVKMEELTEEESYEIMTKMFEVIGKAMQ